ncbi:MAG: tRNA (adenosine(37)-N6)-threonylcarbamoyltransferase complex dimerization subunit type 1 TsaB [Acidothermus sp.]|nr:tRNA (adenosine(37)-N6)-threonylcarbamoyltransferase complex dimerization subunit type 1 TsaB [Acidothermus sp.]
MLLALDTSTPAITAALHDGTEVRAASTTVDAMRHGELLGPTLAKLFEQAGIKPPDLTRVVVGVGPGPFTGLRVGLVTAHALADALGLPVDGVCSLDALAVRVLAERAPDEPFLVATDARRKEVYWASYAPGQNVERLDGPHVDKPADIGWNGPAFGSGVLAYSESFSRVDSPDYPDAGQLAEAVVRGRIAVVPAQPLYLRRPDATPPTGRKPVLQR